MIPAQILKKATPSLSLLVPGSLPPSPLSLSSTWMRLLATSNGMLAVLAIVPATVPRASLLDTDGDYINKIVQKSE